MTNSLDGRTTARRALLRLRVRMWPILQTAVAAVGAWYLAKLLVDEERPVFASIAAVISLGATYGERRERAVELIGGVVVGIAVADLLVRAIGSGPLQVGLMVVLAMAAAVVLGGGPVLVTEAAVSAILLVSLGPADPGISPTRLIEALAGGGVALAVSSLIFPPDPVLMVGRAANAVLGELGHALQEIAAALADRDRERSEAALQAARDIDRDVRALDQALLVGRETARFSPVRRSTRVELERYARSARHIDFAVRNARVLARHVLRLLRSGEVAPAELAKAVHDLSLAVWALAAQFEDPGRATEVRFHASRAAARAVAIYEREPNLVLTETMGQVRSTAIDLVRASEAAAPVGEPPAETPTEELLLDLADPRGAAREPA
ncbi:MAG TPA: FUSC family protein [Thermoleophilaceae bacterium]|nr:FUSC family protein [Thermoleophilaceae bacterium]